MSLSILDLNDYLAVRTGFVIRTSSNPNVPFQYLHFISVEMVSSKEGPTKEKKTFVFEKINPSWEFHEGETIHCQ